MEKFLVKTQKIKATCVVRNNDKVLLLRCNQVVNREHRPQAGYFGVPSFTISFGEDPEIMLQKMLEDYFDQPMNNFLMLDVRQSMSDDNSIQIFEVVYTAKSVTSIQTEDQYDKFLFVHKDELDAYMFPAERERLEKYL